MKIDFQKLLNNKKYCEYVFKDFLDKKIIKENELKFFEKNLIKAEDNLEFANFLLLEHQKSIKEAFPSKTFYDWCITIYYYSIYHASLALLAKVGYESNSHTATISAITLFYYHQDNILNKNDIEFLIEKIHINKEDIDLILNAKGLRERACYGVDRLFELAQAKKLQKETSKFVIKIRSLLE